MSAPPVIKSALKVFFCRNLCTSPLVVLLLSGCVGSYVGKSRLKTIGNYEAELRQIENTELSDLSSEIPTPIESFEDADPLAPPAGSGQEIMAAKANEPFELSLEKAKQLALRHNLGLQAMLVEPNLVSQKISIEKSRFDATFATSTGVEENPLAGLQDYYSAFNGLVLNLPTGGQIAIGQAYSAQNFGSWFSHNASAYNELKIDQPLLVGAGTTIATAPILMAQLQTNRSEAQTKLSMIELLAQVEIAYWQLEASKRERIIHENQVKIAETQLANARQLVEARIFTQAELIRASAGLLARKEALIVSTTAVRLLERRLKTLLQAPQLPINQQTALNCTTQWNTDGVKLDATRLCLMAENQRMELMNIELELLINDVNRKLAKNSRFPNLQMNMRLRDHFEGPSVDNEDYFVGASLSYPFGNRQSKALREANRLERIKLLASENDSKIRIHNEVLNAIDRLDRDWNRIIASTRAALAAQQAFQAELEQNVAGRRTSTEVLEAAKFMADAEIQVIRSMADYAISQVEIALATGTILGASQVQWQPAQ